MERYRKGLDDYEEEDSSSSMQSPSSATGGPLSPDSISEQIDDGVVSESRNVKQSYELFKTLVDEQFEGIFFSFFFYYHVLNSNWVLFFFF